jgi:molybdate transport repressor ModE-like protein
VPKRVTGKPPKGLSDHELPGMNGDKEQLSFTKPALKIWLETEKGYVIGQGTYDLLSKIEALGSLSRAAGSLGMSYRHAWGLIRRMNTSIGGAVLKTHKGGKLGGGGSELTDLGKALLREFNESKDALLGETIESPVEKATGQAHGTVTSVRRAGDRAEVEMTGCITLSLDSKSSTAGKLAVGDMLTARILVTKVTGGEIKGIQKKRALK